MDDWFIENIYKHMRITNWIFGKNRNIIRSNDNIVRGKDQPHSLLRALFLKVSNPRRHFQEKGFDVI